MPERWGHILADRLTLSQPKGQVMPTTLLLAPPDFQTFPQLCKVHKTAHVTCSPMRHLQAIELIQDLYFIFTFGS